MLRVHERDLAALFLRFRHDVQRQRRFTGGFRAVDLNDASLRNAADAKRRVQCQRAGRDRVHVHLRLVAETHNGPFAEILLDLLQCGLQRFFLVAALRVRNIFPLFHAARLSFCFVKPIVSCCVRKIKRLFL